MSPLLVLLTSRPANKNRILQHLGIKIAKSVKWYANKNMDMNEIFLKSANVKNRQKMNFLCF